MQRQATQLLKLKMLFHAVHFSHSAMCCSLQLQHSMSCSMPGLPVHHQLPEFTQSHVHWVGDAIQPSHPLSSPSSTISFSNESFPMSSSHQVAKVLEFQLQHQSFNEYQEKFPFWWNGWMPLLSKGLSRVFSNTTSVPHFSNTIQKHQFFGAQLSL